MTPLVGKANRLAIDWDPVHKTRAPGKVSEWPSFRLVELDELAGPPSTVHQFLLGRTEKNKILFAIILGRPVIRERVRVPVTDSIHFGIRLLW